MAAEGLICVRCGTANHAPGAACDLADVTAWKLDILRHAVQTVLDDNETGAGGWGPDVTMAAVLRDAMEASD